MTSRRLARGEVLPGTGPGGEEGRRPGAPSPDRDFGNGRFRRDGAEGLRLLLGLVSEARRPAHREDRHREQQPDGGDDYENDHGCVSVRLAELMICGLWLGWEAGARVRNESRVLGQMRV